MAKCKNCINFDRAITSDNEYICNWCEKIKDNPHEEIERECDHYVTMTNADRIRSMTDEELAEFLDDIAYCCKGRENETYCSNCRFYFLGECNCVSIGEWLKAEVGCE